MGFNRNCQISAFALSYKIDNWKTFYGVLEVEMAKGKKGKKGKNEDDEFDRIEKEMAAKKA